MIVMIIINTLGIIFCIRHPHVSLHGVGVDPSQNNDGSHDDRRDQIPHHLVSNIMVMMVVKMTVITDNDDRRDQIPHHLISNII